MNIHILFPILSVLLFVSSAHSQSLELTANECFFSPVGTLKAYEVSKTDGTDYNRGSVLSYIYKWENIGDTILWGVKVNTPGTITVTPNMGVVSAQAGSELRIFCNEQSQTLSLTSTGSNTSYQDQASVSFTVNSAGVYQIKMVLTSKSSSGEVGYVNKVKLTGTAISGAEVYLRRWRPLAIHCKWKNTQNNSNITLSVHENTIITTDIDMYQPITTPFGYTGSTWNDGTQTFGGYNFSLWSYGANDPIPPFYQESHLIAVGAGLEFGSYGHEGTGVKPRGNHPYIGVDTNRQVIAVRMEPGEVYNTYWSYYLDPVTQHWKLYGCGKQYNKKQTIEYLWTGAFLEVVGPATLKRSGNVEREIHYRGWQSDEDGNWYVIDSMTQLGNDAVLSYKEWGVTDDGERFYMKSGGFQEEPVTKGSYTLPNPTDKPFYLQGEYLDELYKMPAVLDTLQAVVTSETSASLRLKVIDAGTNATGTLYWGSTEGLTKAEVWEQSASIAITNGINIFPLDGLQENQQYYYRFEVMNAEGTTWTMFTQTFTPNTENIGNIDCSSTIDQSSWTVTYVDSEEATGTGAMAIDGDPSTFWHSNWSGEAPDYPHEIQIHFGKIDSICGMIYTPRTGNANGIVKDYELYVSMDGVNWGTAINSGSFSSGADAKTIFFPKTEARFVKLVCLSQQDGTKWATIAELDFYGEEVSDIPQETQRIELKQGWNLVSLYVVPTDSQTGSVFPNAQIVKTQEGFWDETQQLYLNSLTEVEVSKGYLVYNTVTELVEVIGASTGSATFQLKEGYNLIGITEDILVDDLPADITEIKDFEGFYIKGNAQSTITELKQGKAYYIKK